MEKFENYNIDVLLRDSLLLHKGDQPNEETKLPKSDDADKDAEEELDGPLDIDDNEIENSDSDVNEKEATTKTDDTLNESFTQPSKHTHHPSAVTALDEDDKNVANVANTIGELSHIVVDLEDSETLELSVAKDIKAQPLHVESVNFEKGKRIAHTDVLPEVKTTLDTISNALTSDDEQTQKATLCKGEEESNGSVDIPSKQDDNSLKEAILGNTVYRTSNDDITDLHEDTKVMDLLNDHIDVDKKEEVDGDEKVDANELEDEEMENGNIHIYKYERDSGDFQTTHVQDLKTVKQMNEIRHGNVAVEQEAKSQMSTQLTDENKSEIPEIMASAKSDAFLEKFNDTPVNIELGKKMFNLDESVESFTDSTESQKSKIQLVKGVRTADQDKKHSNEQINIVKNDLINLLENTLNNEKSKTEPEDGIEIYEHSTAVEDLLEDENAVLASKTEGTEKSEEIEPYLKDSHAESEHLEINKDINTDMEESMDLSISPSTKKPTILTITGGDSADKVQYNSTTKDESEYSDSVLRLTVLREHFEDEKIKHILCHLSLKDLFKIESMFQKLELDLKSVRQSSSQTNMDKETIESILEVSENAILDEIDKILELREQKAVEHGEQIDPVMFEEEAAILDDFQELAFTLRKKYSDTVPLVDESKSHFAGNIFVC